jgi:hypothetical protein
MYNLTLGQNGHLVKITNQNNHMSFIPHAFKKNKNSFGQCGHHNQIEPFEKPRFVVMNVYEIQ